MNDDLKRLYVEKLKLVKQLRLLWEQMQLIDKEIKNLTVNK